VPNTYDAAIEVLERAGLLTVTETPDGDLIVTPTPLMLKRIERLTLDDVTPNSEIQTP
jgi:hypothetical protein